VIVLTPFRAQRALLHQRLSLRQLRGVKVSTVHRSQGSEAQVVIFDPVDGASDFLRSAESLRLINVAFSRAQAKLLLVLSPGDLGNPLFAQIANRQRLAGDVREAHPIAELSRRAGFPFSAVGMRVAISRHVGEVSRVAADGTMLWMVNEQTGAEQCFDLAVVLGNIARDET
jgi:DNA replication ATP-dependent helicase Dna2